MYKILFFTKGSRQLASSRMRAHLIADYLRTINLDAHSYHVQTRPWWEISWARLSEFWRNVSLIASLGPGDILFVQRTVYQVDFMCIVLLRKWLFGGRYAFDFDDAIFLEKGHVREKTNLMIRHASLVIVSNSFLKNYALHYNHKVFIMSNLVDTEETYRRVSHPESTRVKIGWTGTQVHYENLKLVLNPLQRLVNDGRQIEFMQVGGGERIHELITSVKGLPVQFVSNLAWGDPKQTAPYIQQFDIGITPLGKTEWNRGKDPGKTKEYMACGAAVVSSDLGDTFNIISHGVNGLLADTEEDWYRVLTQLVVDPEYRRKIADEGRSYIEHTFSYKVFIPELLEALEPLRTK